MWSFRTIPLLFHDTHKFFDDIFVITGGSNTLFPFAKISDCQFYKEGKGSLNALFFI